MNNNNLPDDSFKEFQDKAIYNYIYSKTPDKEINEYK